MLGVGRLRAGRDSERLRCEGLSGPGWRICDDCRGGLREDVSWPVRRDLRVIESTGAALKLGRDESAS